jgi:hypothetical protein
MEGNVLGRHNGLIRYTIGQRKGLGLPFPRPMYVREKNARDNTVTLSGEERLYSKVLFADDLNWIVPPPSDAFRVKAKSRYRQPEQEATIRVEGGRIRVEFDEPSQGDNDENALYMAREGLLLHLWGMEQDKDDIPEPIPAKDLRPGPDQVIVLVDVFMPPFRERMNNKSVAKTVTVPRWLDMEAKSAGLNYSQVLQDGLLERLGIQHQI